MAKGISRSLVVLSIVLNVAFVGTWLAHAVWARWQPVVGGPGEVWCPLHRELNVTPDQWAQIEPLLLQFRGEAEAVCERGRQLREEMLDLLSAAEVDRSAVAGKQEEILGVQREMQELVIAHFLAQREILSAEQRERFFELIRTRESCPRGGPLRGSGPGGSGFGRLFRGNSS